MAIDQINYPLHMKSLKNLFIGHFELDKNQFLHLCYFLWEQVIYTTNDLTHITLLAQNKTSTSQK